MILATLATAYCLHGLMADGTRPDWSRGNPRVLAASDEDLDAGRVRYGDRVCVTFPEGDRITYTVRDRCPGCRAGQVDLQVVNYRRAVNFGRVNLIVTKGRCQ
jgi:3D (Asp-Asp-Asp) domain-containing protein